MSNGLGLLQTTYKETNPVSYQGSFRLKHHTINSTAFIFPQVRDTQESQDIKSELSQANC